MIIKRNEMDRPTNNSLQYLTTVRPHKINRENLLVDQFVHETLSESLGIDVVEEFGQYTRSFYTLEGHYHNLWKYDRIILPKPDDPLLDMAIERTRYEYQLPTKVKSIGWDSLAEVPFISSSSSGWGFVGKKGAPGNHEKAISKAVLSLKWWLEDKQNGTNTFRYHPDLAWTRTQMGTVEDPKIRSVWGKSFDNIILEGITASPLINAYRIGTTPMPVGMNYYKRLPTMINQSLYDGNTHYYGVGIDLKSFDSSVQPWLINESFNILEQNIDFTDDMGRRSFEYSKEFFIHTPVVMPDGRMWLKHVGVPSGSYFTQMIDSIANSIATHYAQLCIYGQMFRTYCLGDDSLFGVPVGFGRPELSTFAEHYAKVGMLLHPDKGIVATRPDQLEFLGHCASGSRVDRETAAMMRLALYPEHPVYGPAQSMNRVKGILLDSAMNSWPMIHLHNIMMSRYRNELMTAEDTFIGSDKDWLIAVLNIAEPPSHINEVTTFLLT
uniref:RdRp n=1 Tax=Hubei partiti-like virus 56 TaxID=1923065 RepID=A0A1L3KLJ6_9VIRU|nr:RdRp [Hubei partiti-like virus 56]